MQWNCDNFDIHYDSEGDDKKPPIRVVIKLAVDDLAEKHASFLAKEENERLQKTQNNDTEDAEQIRRKALGRVKSEMGSVKHKQDDEDEIEEEDDDTTGVHSTTKPPKHKRKKTSSTVDSARPPNSSGGLGEDELAKQVKALMHLKEKRLGIQQQHEERKLLEAHNKQTQLELEKRRMEMEERRFHLYVEGMKDSKKD